MPRVLFVDDDADLGRLVVVELAARDYDVRATTTGIAALEMMHTWRPEVVVSDLQMEGMDGWELCRRLRAEHAAIPVILVTAHGDMDAAIAALRAGARDFVPKPLTGEGLSAALRRVLGPAYDDDADELGHPLVRGTNPGMHAAVALVDRVSPFEVPVLICGESGTGKELLARRIHERSPRARGPFIAVNCAAIPDALVESEFFGHVRGAFTDARKDQPGLLLRANGGTLFLDEIGELSSSVQPKLLRALQEKTVRPVGGDREVPWDARVVSATNRNLEDACTSGRFRSDLLYRLDVVRVNVPPLRARHEDILLYARHFLASASRDLGRPVPTLSPDACRRLTEHPWPGNLRELQNCMQRAAIVANDNELRVADLPDTLRRDAAAAATREPLVSLEELERRHLHEVLAATAGNKTDAARILGIERKTLYRKLARLGVEPPVPQPGRK